MFIILVPSQSDLYAYANSRTRYLQMGVPLVEKKEMIKFLNRDKSSTQYSQSKILLK